MNDNPNIPNFKIFNGSNNNENIISVDRLDGFSILFNLKSLKIKFFLMKIFFCILKMMIYNSKSKEKKELIYLIKNSKIEHTGGISQNFNFEKLKTGIGCGLNFILIKNIMVI